MNNERGALEGKELHDLGKEGMKREENCWLDEMKWRGNDDGGRKRVNDSVDSVVSFKSVPRLSGQEKDLMVNVEVDR